MHKIIVKINSYFLSCEKVKGAETEFLGFQIDSFEKVKDLNLIEKEGFKEFTVEDLKNENMERLNIKDEKEAYKCALEDYHDRLCCFMDIRAMNALYNSDCVYDEEEEETDFLEKYSCYAKSLLRKINNDGSAEFLYVFDNDGFSKFVYLFKLENRLFQWTY